jgi:outer membrane scaffolding protein for murein synthesis (MipA/OmpV family)
MQVRAWTITAWHRTWHPAWWCSLARSFSGLLALGLIPALLAAVPAVAQDQPLWELGLGVGALQLPHYRGSDQTHDWLLPLPYAIYRGKIFRATREGARAVLLESERLDIDLSVAASAPVRSDGNRARQGMPELAATLELGPNINFRLAQGSNWKLDLRLPVHAVMSLERSPQGLGWTANPVINLDTRLAGWNLGLQAGPLFGSTKYHDHFYGVDAQFAQTGRSAYRAKSGFGGTRMTVGLSRRVGQGWLGAFVRADSVAGAAFEGSPLVRQSHNLAAGLAFSWVFFSSAQRVQIDD